MPERHGHLGTAIQQRSFEAPDEVRRFPNGIVELVRVGAVTMGRGTLAPGFRWSTSLQPIQGTPSCQIHHLQLMLKGRLHVEMDDGESTEFVAGEVMNVPPGHDVWVVGDEPVVVVDVFGNIGALAVPGERERLVTTLLMSDIVESTRTASRLGDAAWRQLLSEHNRLVRAQFGRFRGAGAGRVLNPQVTAASEIASPIRHGRVRGLRRRCSSAPVAIRSWNGGRRSSDTAWNVAPR